MLSGSLYSNHGQFTYGHIRAQRISQRVVLTQRATESSREVWKNHTFIDPRQTQKIRNSEVALEF